jgi:hypothetical protein
MSGVDGLAANPLPAPRRDGRIATVTLAVVGLTLLLVGACAPSDQPLPSVPAETIGPAMTVSPAVNQTRAELVRVLGAVNLILADTQTPVRPAEAPLLLAAPRAVFQVTLPADPTRGYIVVYDFADSSRAADAAA